MHLSLGNRLTPDIVTLLIWHYPVPYLSTKTETGSCWRKALLHAGQHDPALFVLRRQQKGMEDL